MSDTAAQEAYNKYMRLMETLARYGFRLTEMLVKEAIEEAKDIKARVIEAQDPAKAMQQEIDRATRAAKDQIEELRVNGFVDNVTARDMKASIDSMTKYYDLEDGCTKAATMDKFTEKCQEKQREFFKTHDKSIFKDMDKFADDFTKIPRAVYMDDSRLHRPIKELKADIAIKEAVKDMEKTVFKNRIKNGLDELVR